LNTLAWDKRNPKTNRALGETGLSGGGGRRSPAGPPHQVAQPTALAALVVSLAFLGGSGLSVLQESAGEAGSLPFESRLPVRLSHGFRGREGSD
jgi:hypothetical protein